MNMVHLLSTYDKKILFNQYRAITQANKSKVSIISNRELDRYLLENNTILKEQRLYPLWTGTYIIFDGPNKSLGPEIIYTDPAKKERYIFEVKIYKPEAIGQRNIAFVINHGFSTFDSNLPVFELVKDSKDYLLKINDISALKVLNIPSIPGWYLADPEFGIPTITRTSSTDPNACYLFRDKNYCGLLARGGWHNSMLYADFRPSILFKVLVVKNST